MTEADRETYRAEAASLADRLSGGDSERAVWEVYAGTERLIAVLKFRLDYETPGVFTKLPDASDPAGLLRDARALLLRASEGIARGKLVASIPILRKARNDLRSYLVEAKKSATRAESQDRAVSENQ